MRLNPFSTEISWRDRAIDALVGAVAVLGFAPFHIWPATVLALAVFCARLRTATSGREGASQGFWTGLGYFAAGLVWITQAFIERGPEYIPLIVPLVFGLFVLLSLFWALAGWTFAKARRGWTDALLFASLLFMAEFARGHLFGGFPWNLPGYAFEAGTALSQFASIGGVYGLSFLLLLVSGALGTAWGETGRARMGWIGAAALVLGGLFVFGSLRLSGAEVESREDVVVRLVHVPFRQSEMMDRANSVAITNRYFEETLRTPLDGVTHIVWPEGAVRGIAMDNLAFVSVFPSLIEGDVPTFLFSSIREERSPAFRDGRQWYNSAVAVEYTDGVPGVAAFVDKKRLVPFGEIVPFGPVLEKIGLEAIAASFTPAPDKPVTDYPGLPGLSVQICYEVIFSGLTEGQPSLILNQSNDAWFGDWHGPAQHAAIARMRAVEEGVPILRMAANGESGLVDPYGRWVKKLPPSAVGHADLTLVQPIAPTTFNLFINGLLLVTSLLVVCGTWRLARPVGQPDAPQKG